MDANQQPAQLPPQANGQSAPRPPQLDAQTFAMLSELDGFLAKTPVNRAEGAQMNNLMQTLLRKLETDEQERKRLLERCNSMDAELVKLRNQVQAARVVDEVLAEPARSK